jgi:predicted ATPase
MFEPSRLAQQCLADGCHPESCVMVCSKKTWKLTLQAAEAVARAAGDLSVSVLEAVGSLVDKSLLQLQEENGQELQLHLFVLLRQFGLERLAASGELEQCQAAYYLALSEQAGKVLDSSLQGHWLAQLELELENLRAALQWLLACPDAETATRMAWALRQFWFLGGHLSEGRRFLEQALAALGEDNVGLARLRSWLPGISTARPHISTRLFQRKPGAVSTAV